MRASENFLILLITDITPVDGRNPNSGGLTAGLPSQLHSPRLQENPDL